MIEKLFWNKLTRRSWSMLAAWLALMVSAFVSSRAISAPIEETKDFLKMDNLFLKIILAPKLVGQIASSSIDAKEICTALANPLRVGNGPWGFGLFSGDPDCEAQTAVSQQGLNETFDPSKSTLWQLRVDLNETGQAVIVLVRPRGKDREKVEATVTVPTSKFLPQLLADSRFDRLLAAVILDQVPFRSKLTKELLSSSPFLTPKSESGTQDPFRMPAHTEPLIPVAVELSPATGYFKVSAKNNSDFNSLDQKNIWLLTKKRGQMVSEIFSQISKATEILGREQQQKQERSLNASKIKGRKERWDAKSLRPFWNRIETVAELRGRASVYGTQDNSIGLENNFVFTAGPFTNLWISAQFLHAKIQYQIPSSDPAIGSNIVGDGFRTSFVASVGPGVRIPMKSDHIVFFYPRLECGIIDWKIEKLPALLRAKQTGFSFRERLMPGIGAVLGYQSPEAMPVQWQARLGGTGMTSVGFSSLMADVAGSWRSPLAFSSGRAEIFAFGLYEGSQLTKTDGKTDVVKEFSLRATDFAFGGGYRWMWL